MGFLSKLFGSETEKMAKDLLSGLAENSNQSGTQESDAPIEGIGCSYGPKKPAEENQYNFNGNYVKYFETIYGEEFPEYQIDHEDEERLRSSIFTFRRNGQIALVVELLSETSRRKKVRTDCAMNHIPYLRFYYNHHGWWNTRSYVINRTKDALK